MVTIVRKEGRVKMLQKYFFFLFFFLFFSFFLFIHQSISFKVHSIDGGIIEIEQFKWNDGNSLRD